MFLVFINRCSLLQKKRDHGKRKICRDDNYVKKLASSGQLKIRFYAVLIEATRAYFAEYHHLISCLYVSHLVWSLSGLFTLCLGSLFACSVKACQSVCSSYRAVVTVELVDSTRIVVRTFAPSSQTLLRTCQVVCSASYLKTVRKL